MLQTLDRPAIDQTTLRVSALHALAYCPRLFYLEEVEELYTQDAAVFAGRRLHAELAKSEDEDWDELSLESPDVSKPPMPQGVEHLLGKGWEPGFCRVQTSDTTRR